MFPRPFRKLEREQGAFLNETQRTLINEKFEILQQASFGFTQDRPYSSGRRNPFPAPFDPRHLALLAPLIEARASVASVLRMRRRTVATIPTALAWNGREHQ